MRPVADLSVAVAETRRDVYVDLGRREPQPGAWNVPVEIGIDGVRVQTVWVNLDVKLYEEQPVAARDLRRGDAIDASCWRLQRTLVEATAPRSATPHGLMGATSTRDIAAGLRIAETDVRREPLVRPGDSVELEVVRGSVRARSRAIARGQGSRGDRVEDQCGDGQRRLVGIVVQRGLVRVELASSPRNSR
jgi:flagella basal body P-ring formation protein FlgA